MKITRVEAFHLEHRLRRAAGCSTGMYESRDVLLVKISTDEGLVGWGETAPLGGLPSLIEQQYGPQLVGKDPLRHRSLWRTLWGPNFGNGLALAAVDIALHDLRGKALGVPVAELLGGRQRDRVPVYVSCMNYTEGIEPEEQYPADAREAAGRGFKAMKMRIGRYPPRRELKFITAVREAVGPDVKLMADGNAAYTRKQAEEVGRELARLGFYWFEEPMPQASARYPGYDGLAEKLDVALAGGEALDSRGCAHDLLRRRLFDVIQPDATLCGGLAECLFIAEMAEQWGTLCFPHCWGGAVAVAATVHLLAVLPDATWAPITEVPLLELDQIESRFRDELASRPITIREGDALVPTSPGLGIEIDEDVVRRYRKK
jgi:D-galactarolactone cycloisomerase